MVRMITIAIPYLMIKVVPIIRESNKKGGDNNTSYSPGMVSLGCR